MKDIRKLLEFAMELGDTPDAIHPAHKHALQTGDHPLGANPAFPPHQGQGMNPHEKHAVGTYKSIIANLQRYGGYVPRNQRDSMGAAQDMFLTLNQIQQREAAHADVLEQLAVETVMRLPEFKILRKAVQAGQLKIEAFLNRRININGVQFSDEENTEIPDADVPEIAQEYDELIHKRKMINTLIQGAAVSNNYAFAYYVRDELRDIDPSLINAYGKLMAYTELGYFIQDPQMMKLAAAAGGGEAQGGDERLKRNDDGSVSIVARGISFPILVQEIIKGCMEYLSLSDEDDPETQVLVNKKADTADDEMVQMQVGPNIYRQLIDAIGMEQADVMPYIHDELVRMPAAEFNRQMQGLVAGTPEGKRWFQQLAQRIKQEVQAELGDESS